MGLMLITTQVEVTPRRIADLMVTAIEGGINYWCGSVNLISQPKAGLKEPWYDDESLYADGSSIRIRVKELDPSSSIKEWIIDINKMKFAFALMQDFGNPKGYCWRDFINENEDAITADVWFQLAVFGEVVYG
jgi:hypothetical protein